jgi:hypothetical protein
VRRVYLLKLIEIDPLEEGRPRGQRNLNRYVARRRTGSDFDLCVFTGVDFVVVNRAAAVLYPKLILLQPM